MVYEKNWKNNTWQIVQYTRVGKHNRWQRRVIERGIETKEQAVGMLGLLLTKGEVAWS